MYLPEKDKRYLGDVKLTYRRMITLALKLCKASSGEENLERVHRPVIMHHCVSYLGSASIVLLAFEQALLFGERVKKSHPFLKQTACSQANCCELSGSQSK